MEEIFRNSISRSLCSELAESLPAFLYQLRIDNIGGPIMENMAMRLNSIHILTNWYDFHLKISPPKMARSGPDTPQTLRVSQILAKTLINNHQKVILNV